MENEIEILGTTYKIIRKHHEDDPAFKESSIDGYCDPYLKEIVICEGSTNPAWKNEPDATIRIYEKQTLRHEIVHAFLDESGLNDNAARYYDAWSKNEEMVDWIAWQGPKIYQAWEYAGAL